MNRPFLMLLVLLSISINALSQLSSNDYLSRADELMSKAKIVEASTNYRAADSLFTLEKNWVSKYKAVYGAMYCKLRLGKGEEMSNGLDVAIQDAETYLGSNHIALADLHYLKALHSDRFLGAKSNLIHLMKVDEILDNSTDVDDVFLAKFYNIKGITSYKLKDYQKALDYYNQSLFIKKKLYGSDSPKIGTTYNNIGVCYFVQNDLEQATFYYEKALQNKLKVLGPDHPRVADSQFNIGLIYSNMEAYDKAEEKVKEALRIAIINEEEQAFKIAHRTSELAIIYRNTNREKEAIETGLEAIEYYKKANQSPIYSATGYQIQGLTQGYFGHYDKALFNFQLGFKELTGDTEIDNYAFNPPLDAYSANGRMHQLLQYKSETLYDWYLKSNNIDRLQESFKTCEDLIICTKMILSDIKEEKSLYNFISDSRNNFEFALKVAQTLYNVTKDETIIERALWIYEESRAALFQRSLAVNIAQKHAGIPPELVEKKSNVNQEINRLVLLLSNIRDSTALARNRGNILDLKEEYESIVSEINTYLPSIDLNQLRQKEDHFKTLLSDDDSQIIAWFYGQEDLYRFTNINTSITFEKLPKRDSLDQRIKDLSKIIGDRELASSRFGSKQLMDDFYRLSTSIYDDVIPKPLSVDKEIVLIPDGLLSAIPLEILVDSEGSTSGTDYANLNYMINKAPIRYISAPSMLVKHSSGGRGNNILAFAPTYESDDIPLLALRSGFSKLDYAGVEVENIANNFPTNLMIGANANKANLLNNIERYAILHFAMHAFTNEEEPAYSALVFNSESSKEDSSSVLYAYEIADLDLQSELAVLSACNTGSGKLIDGEGPISIARSFQIAGCPNTVMSLWQVDDESTSLIMESFYGNLESGMGKSQALQQAKLSFLKSNRKNLPFYWSAFILNGDNEPIQLGPNHLPLLLIGAGLLILGLFFFYNRSRLRNKA